MAIHRRAPQDGDPNDHSSYTSNPNDFGYSVPATASVGPTIAADTGTPTVNTTPSLTPSVTPTPAQVSSQPTTSAPPSGHRPLPAKTIVAIVVPIAVVLLIPLLYLLYRSHRIKKDVQKQSSQRNSREAMLAKEMLEPKNSSGPPPPRPRRSLAENKELPQPRPTNSLGLFNFDFSQPTSPAADGQRTPPRLSIARSLQFRRSELFGSKSGRKSQPSAGMPRDPLRNNPTTGNQDPSTIVFGEPPPAYGSSDTSTGAGAGAPPSESHFAPLNLIGTAVSHPPRTRPTRSPSSGNSVPRDATTSPTPHAYPNASSVPAPINSAFVNQGDRNIQAPTSIYSNTSTHHSSSLLPPLPTALSNSPPTPPQQESRPVSPLNSDSTRSTNTATNKSYHIPDFGLGMGGGHFSMSDYSDEPSGSGRDPHPNPSTLQTFAPPNAGHQPNDRISDVSGLSIDPTWLSQEERDRRHGAGDGSGGSGPRISTSSSDHVVSPVDSHGSFRGRDRL